MLYCSKKSFVMVVCLMCLCGISVYDRSVDQRAKKQMRYHGVVASKVLSLFSVVLKIIYIPVYIYIYRYILIPIYIYILYIYTYIYKPPKTKKKIICENMIHKCVRSLLYRTGSLKTSPPKWVIYLIL